jgi:hypothetical protein
MDRSPFSRGPTSARKEFPQFSLPESSDISFIGVAPGRRSVDRPSYPPRLSTGSDNPYEQHSFEAPRPGWGDFGNESTSNSQTSVSSLPAVPHTTHTVAMRTHGSAINRANFNA